MKAKKTVYTIENLPKELRSLKIHTDPRAAELAMMLDGESLLFEKPINPKPKRAK